MANDAVLGTCLVWLGGVVLVTGLYTHSFNKMFVTYILGMCGICGVLLPDWDFFNRDFAQWASPLTFNNHSDGSQSNAHTPSRSRLYPIRLVVYTVVYGFALYKWWIFISSS